MEDPTLKCFYSILGVHKDSSAAEIRTAYRKLAMRCHPDKCANAKADQEPAKLKFEVVQKAYSVLSDEHKRFMYDTGLYNAEDDPDVLGELVRMMKGACEKAAFSKKISVDDEFQNMRKRFVNVADKGNSVRYFTQFSSSSLGNHGQEQHSKMELNQQPPACAPPKAHPSLFTAMGCSNYNFSDYAEDSSTYACEFEQLVTSCPQPHPNLFTGSSSYDSVPEDIQALLDDLESSGHSLTLTSNSAPTEFSVHPSHISGGSASGSEALTTETPFAPGGTSVAPDINSRGFCTGVFGSATGQDLRGQGKCMKWRRNKPRRQL